MVDAIKGALASPLLLVSLRSRHASLSGELSLVVLVAGVVFQETSSSILDIRPTERIVLLKTDFLQGDCNFLLMDPEI